MIIADNITIDFPIYGSRSFKNTVISNITGGRVSIVDSCSIVRALNHVTFRANDGDRIGLWGHNGSGKTTLLRTIAGVYYPTEGSIKLNGSISSLLNISLGMDQEATGLENIYMRAAMMGIYSKELAKYIDEIIEFTELGSYINMPMRVYSSGMKMRLQFATSISVKSDIVLMDEWLSVGDEAFSVKAEEALQKKLKDSRLLVLASHSESMLHKICNRIFKMEHGEIIGELRKGVDF